MQCLRRNFVTSVSRFPIVAQRNVIPPRFLHASPIGLAPKKNYFSSNVNLQQHDGASPEPVAQPITPPKQKPKRKPARSPAAKTSMRRAAAKAQQETISKEPAETSDKQVTAICVAEEFDMEEVVSLLKQNGFTVDPDSTGYLSDQVVHARSFNNGDIFVFPSGVLVSWSLPEDSVTDLATKTLSRATVNPSIKDAELENLEFEEDPHREHSSLKGDVITLGTKAEVQSPSGKLDTTRAKIAFSYGLARSTKLARLETMLANYIESTRSVPITMSQGGTMPLGRREVMQRTGQLLNLRAQLNHYSELTDSLPDLFWDSPHELGLEQYYDQTCRSLDVNVRIKTLNEKMDYAQEIASILRETLSAQHSSNLEWIIIALILIEVLFMLNKEFKQWWNNPKEQKKATDH